MDCVIETKAIIRMRCRLYATCHLRGDFSDVLQGYRHQSPVSRQLLLCVGKALGMSAPAVMCDVISSGSQHQQYQRFSGDA